MMNPESVYLKSLFMLDPEVTYLNFGSFGACAAEIFEDYIKWERELEREPVQFVTVKGPVLLKASRDALGSFVGCHGDDLVYVPNPSYAVNIVARSLGLKAGDEVLSTDLEYGACDKAWDYCCSKAGAKFVRQHITLPLVSAEKFVKEFAAGITSNTKAIYISQITSSTALIFPVKQICDLARKKGLLCIVDGAHVPGHIPLNISELDCDIYTGACHKWMMTPKGCSFLYVRRNLQERFDPLVVSWGYKSSKPSGSQFLDYHQFQGTRDFSAFLTVPAAISFMNKHGWTEVAARSRTLVRKNAKAICDILSTKPLAPLTDEFIGQMLSLEINTANPEELQTLLFTKYRIEVPVMSHGKKVYLRYSINGFNSQADLDKLAGALYEIIKGTSQIKVK